MSLSCNLIEKSSYTLKRESSWSGEAKIYKFFPPSFAHEQKSSHSPTLAVPSEVKELVQELAKVENIHRVRTVAPNAPDIHIIDFELELQPETDLSAEAWDKIQDLVIDSEWKLRDETNEKWYFHAEVVEAFFQLKAGTEVIVEPYIQRSKSSRTTFSPMTIQTKHYISV